MPLNDTVCICPTCGKEFRPSPRNPKQRFCGYPCSNKATASRRILAERPCERCGKMFKPLSSRRRFCSKTCSNSHGGWLARQETIKAGYPWTSTCPTCGSDVVHEAPHDDARLYCGHACAMRASNARQAARRAVGILPEPAPARECRQCGKSFVPPRGVWKSVFCSPACRSTADRRAAKREAIEAYGGCCSCCGEGHIEFLTLDHVDGDGARQRKALKGETRGRVQGTEFYRWLKRQGWPQEPRLRVLCANCNLSTGWYGYCPHTY